jgi:hypothetical protein
MAWGVPTNYLSNQWYGYGFNRTSDNPTYTNSVKYGGDTGNTI